MTDLIPIDVGFMSDISTRLKQLRQQIAATFLIPRHLLPTYQVWAHRARFTEGRVLEPDPAATEEPLKELAERAVSCKHIQVMYWCPWSSLWEITVDGNTDLYLVRVEEVKHASIDSSESTGITGDTGSGTT